MRRSLTLTAILILALAALGRPADALGPERPETGWCGTDGYHSNLIEADARHRLFQRLTALERSKAVKTAALQTGAAFSIRKEGKVAVIDADGTLVRAQNAFDLSNSAILYKKKKDKVRAISKKTGINQDFGERISNEDWGTCNALAEPGDDAAFRLDLPFKAKFYGVKYRTLYVNSDGTVTFGAPDCSSEERGLERFLNGPPAIAGLFRDLDPGSTSGEQGVFVNRGSKKVQITWRGVPQFDGDDSNTFQITIFKSRATVVSGDVETDEAIVGVTPGGGRGVNLVDFSEELPVSPTESAILEQFSLLTVVDPFAVSEAFFGHFKDDYDYLVIWYDFDALVGSVPEVVAHHIGIKNEIGGIGRDVFDFTEFVGSDGRLESLVEMGWIEKYPLNLDQTLLATHSTLDILGHEAGHRWLAKPLFRDGDVASDELLGRGKAHWSFFFDSDESDLEGNDIMDLGGGSFETMGATSGYSKLDQYLMGLAPAEDVPPLFLVRSPDRGDPEDPPQVGVRFNGERKDLTVQDVIDVHGPRVPSVEDSQKAFKMAFVLLGHPDRPARQFSIDRLNSIAKEWEAYFRDATDGLGRMKMSLKERK